MKQNLKKIVGKLKAREILYRYRLLVDQQYVKKQLKGKAVIFRSGRTPRLGIRADDFTWQGVSLDRLDAVVECLESIGVEYFVVPNSSRTKYGLGVVAENRQRVLNAFNKQLANTGLYISDTEDPVKRQIVSDKRSLKTFSNTASIQIYNFVLSPHGYLLSGDDNNLRIDFWEHSDSEVNRRVIQSMLSKVKVSVEPENLVNTLVAPVANDFTGILPLDEAVVTKIDIAGKEYRTYDVFAKKTINYIDFPIDIVYSWVDGSDPRWRKKFNKYKGIEEDISERNNTESRYRDRQELKYSLRSIHMYAPWVRNIYIVTDSQVPDWLNTAAEGIKIVDHKDIFTDKSVLPVFNSHAIGAQLHHIEGLSDRYLYLNDDVMFGRYVIGQHFFHANGIAKVAISSAQIHAGNPNDYEPAPSSAGKNVRAALENSTGRFITHKFKHTPNPQIKQVAYEIENIYQDLVQKTIKSRFRSKNDIQFAGLFHHSYALLTGRATMSNLKVAVVNISQDGAQDALTWLLTSREAYTICLNESETADNRQGDVNDMVGDFFEQYYPYPSPWENR